MILLECSLRVERNLHIAATHAGDYFRAEDDFYRHYLKSHFQCDMADVNLGYIIDQMNTYLHHIERDICIYSWKPSWRWTKAKAMTMGDGHIRINKYKLKRSAAEFIETIVHEICHIADTWDVFHEWHHGRGWRRNYSKGKKFTAPYLIGWLAKQYLERGILYTDTELVAMRMEYENGI